MAKWAANEHDQINKDPATKLPIVTNTTRKSILPADLLAELLVVVDVAAVTFGKTVEAGSEVTVD